MTYSEAFIHETAVVEEGATVGPGTKVWHHGQVSAGASVGARCVLGKNVFIGRDVSIADGVKIQNNVSVYAGVTLEEEVFVGPSATFTNVVNPRSGVERKSEFKTTRVGRGASIGANVTIVCGHDLGEYCFIGAGAVVTKDVPPFALMVGNPARQIGWVNEKGDRAPGPPEGASASAAPIGALDAQAEAREHGDAYTRAFQRVLHSGQYILGPEVTSFEEEIASYVGAKHAVGMASGTDALLAALLARGIGAGDEVVTTPFSFFATVGAILRVGATPVFVDIDPRSFNIDVEAARSAITSKTKAVIGVQLFGQSFDQSELRAACAERGVFLVEDAAQSFGAQGASSMVGTEGDVGCYSFFPTKNLGGFGDGGGAVTNDEELARTLRQVRAHGATRKYHHELMGGNFRLDPLHAALLRERLPRLPAELDQRKRNADAYDRLFKDAGLVEQGHLTPPPRVGPDHTFNQYVIRAKRRDELRDALIQDKITAVVYYPELLSEQPIVQGKARSEGDLSQAKLACQQVLALPIHPRLTLAEQERVVHAIAEFYA